MDIENIGVIGGTGALGRGIAGRLAMAGKRVYVGSRDRAKAEQSVKELKGEIDKIAKIDPNGSNDNSRNDDNNGNRSNGGSSNGNRSNGGNIGNIDGELIPADNVEAASKAEVVFLAVPAKASEDLLASLKPHLKGKLLIDCTVDLNPKDITTIRPKDQPTAVEMAQALGDEVRVIAGFHTVAAAKLADFENDASADTLIVGDDEQDKAIGIELAKLMGLRAFDAGPLMQGGTLERMTALLIGMNKRYRRRAIGVKLTGI